MPLTQSTMRIIVPASPAPGIPAIPSREFLADATLAAGDVLVKNATGRVAKAAGNPTNDDIIGVADSAAVAGATFTAALALPHVEFEANLLSAADTDLAAGLITDVLREYVLQFTSPWFYLIQSTTTPQCLTTGFGRQLDSTQQARRYIVPAAVNPRMLFSFRNSAFHIDSP